MSKTVDVSKSGRSRSLYDVCVSAARRPLKKGPSGRRLLSGIARREQVGRKARSGYLTRYPRDADLASVRVLGELPQGGAASVNAGVHA